MHDGPKFQMLDSENQTNTPPEGEKDGTVNCWFCSHTPPRTRFECPKCGLCFLPTEGRTDDRKTIVWYIGYLSDSQTPEEIKIVLDRLAKQFTKSTTNAAVCCRGQDSSLLVVLRQLDGNRQFSVKKDGKVIKTMKGQVIWAWTEFKDLRADIKRELKGLIVYADGKLPIWYPK